MSKKSHLGKRARGQEGDGPQLVPAPAPAPATSSGGDKLFRCGSCHKSYSRVDHLSRHVRLHTQVRSAEGYAAQKGGLPSMGPRWLTGSRPLGATVCVSSMREKLLESVSAA